MAADHVQRTEVDDTAAGGISPTVEFVLFMVITGVIAFGGVAILTV